MGYIYKEIGLIIALIMLGIFLSNLRLYLKPNRPQKNKTKILKFYLLSSLLLTVVLLIFIANLSLFNFTAIKIILLSLALASGYFSGAIYPLANALYLEKKSAPENETGKIYGLELIGGGVILIIFSFFILPFWGITMLAVYLIYWLGLLNYLMAEE